MARAGKADAVARHSRPAFIRMSTGARDSISSISPVTRGPRNERRLPDCDLTAIRGLTLTDKSNTDFCSSVPWPCFPTSAMCVAWTAAARLTASQSDRSAWYPFPPSIIRGTLGVARGSARPRPRLPPAARAPRKPPLRWLSEPRWCGSRFTLRRLPRLPHLTRSAPSADVAPGCSWSGSTLHGANTCRGTYFFTAISIAATMASTARVAPKAIRHIFQLR